MILNKKTLIIQVDILIMCLLPHLVLSFQKFNWFVIIMSHSINFFGIVLFLSLSFTNLGLAKKALCTNLSLNFRM